MKSRFVVVRTARFQCIAGFCRAASARELAKDEKRKSPGWAVRMHSMKGGRERPVGGTPMA